ncbi:hypothetical protein LEMLEM_LOCUS18019 [Lemmus lemmus]
MGELPRAWRRVIGSGECCSRGLRQGQSWRRSQQRLQLRAEQFSRQ